MPDLGLCEADVVLQLSDPSVSKAVADQLTTHLSFVRRIDIDEAIDSFTPVIVVTDQPVETVEQWQEKAPGADLPEMVLVGRSSDREGEPAPGIEQARTDVEPLEVMAAVQRALLSRWRSRAQALESDIAERNELLNHIRGELSTFYHSINNPLTILSGNLQLLNLIASSNSVSADVMKPIEDISEISARFEEDLQQIVRLRERIDAGKEMK